MRRGVCGRVEILGERMGGSAGLEARGLEEEDEIVEYEGEEGSFRDDNSHFALCELLSANSPVRTTGAVQSSGCGYEREMFPLSSPLARTSAWGLRGHGESSAGCKSILGSDWGEVIRDNSSCHS